MAGSRANWEDQTAKDAEMNAAMERMGLKPLSKSKEERASAPKEAPKATPKSEPKKNDISIGGTLKKLKEHNKQLEDTLKY
jgi:hypothetical protein